MRKVSTFEELLHDPNAPSTKSLDGTPLGLLFALKDLDAYRFEDLSEGQLGMAFIDKNHSPDDPEEQRAFQWVETIFDKPIEKECNDFETFRQIFEQCLAKNHYLIKYDDVERMKMGFICLTNKATTWYKIGYRTFHQGYVLYQQKMSWQKQMEDTVAIREKEKDLG
jgi:hypothetical protein